MGGNAITNAIRLDKDKFEQYTEWVMPRIQSMYKKAKPLKYYRNKQDFGDLDILVTERYCTQEDLIAFLKEGALQSKQVVNNNGDLSFEFRGFQVDLVKVPAECFDAAYFYYSYNDLNNLVGRMAHKLGLKFGWDGLYLPFRSILGPEHTHVTDKVLLTRDPRKIYEFLYLDYDRYLKGFDDLEDIFKFVVSSPYFNKEIFSYENMNHINRLRNRKRKTYQMFLDWLEAHSNTVPDELANVPVEEIGSVARKITFNAFQYNKIKFVYFDMIAAAFPEADLHNKLVEFHAKHAVIKQVKEKFNGNLVMSWIPSLTGEMLGKFMAWYKQSHANDEGEFNSWMIRHTLYEIADDVKTEYILFLISLKTAADK